MKRELKIKLFADGADINEMKDAYLKGIVKGFTTNPTLMRKAGIPDYKSFAKAVLSEIRDMPISFEVFSDDFASMEREAREISRWGENVYVKIPITNTKGASSIPLVRQLSADGIQLNVTAILTIDQVRGVKNALSPAAPAIVSVFAGRIADTGRDPIPIMEECVALLAGNPSVELLWASSRELLNVFQAEKVGCHIITITNRYIEKTLPCRQGPKRIVLRYSQNVL